MTASRRAGPIVMITTIFLLGMAARGEAVALPRPHGWVSDLAQSLDDQTRTRLEVLLGELEQKTGDEVAVVVVPALEGESLEQYANDLFKGWGIGKKGKDNGVLILVALSDRRVRIETGYGVEGILPDGLCGDIIRTAMIPYFKEGRYAAGIVSGTTTVARLLARARGVPLTQPFTGEGVRGPQRGSRPPSWWTILLMFAPWMIFLGPLVLLLAAQGTRGRRYRPGAGIWFGPAGGVGGGMRWGGGGFSSGFGGFGGGLSGGGGASGGW